MSGDEIIRLILDYGGSAKSTEDLTSKLDRASDWTERQAGRGLREGIEPPARRHAIAVSTRPGEPLRQPHSASAGAFAAPTTILMSGGKS